MITYLQATLIGLLQGVTELFPVSSLGHSVLVPAFIGGSWEHLVTESSSGDSGTSPYLAFIVALHCATALALLLFFRNDWVRIIRGFLRSLRPSIAARRIVTADTDERLAWLIVVATIPVGITGLALEHTFRTLFAKPLAAAIFLTINGLILLAGERLRRSAAVDPEDVELTVDAPLTTSGGVATVTAAAPAVPRRRLATLSYRE
ncbi:MAG: undecaprenyl-diphosphatase, partial [Frankiales bacterium]|nr:undecaprenyl-diphosphatase [Frankiales bacterium]